MPEVKKIKKLINTGFAIIAAMLTCVVIGCASGNTETNAEDEGEVTDNFGGFTETEDGNGSTGESDSDISEEEISTSGNTSKSEVLPTPVVYTFTDDIADDEFVRIKDYIPDIEVDLRYATENNFTGEVIYSFNEAYLRYGTVKKLARAEESLAEYGYVIKIWDAFRPVEAQYKLWEVCPNSVYVSNPYKGTSKHSNGGTVDITIVNTDGSEVLMPTGFDDFSIKADRDYSDCDKEAADNARLLEDIMKKCGFIPYSGEWWHFSDEDKYSAEYDFVPGK